MRFSNKKERMPLVVITAILLFTGFMGLKTLMQYSFLFSLDDVTDSSKYQTILKHVGYPDNKLFSHFPKKIPIGKTNVGFLYRPQLFQGSMDMQLRFKPEPEEIQSILEEYTPKAIEIGKGNDLGENSKYLLTFYDKDSQMFTKLSNDFEVIILGSEGAIGGHGFNYGIAVNKTKPEVIYWARKWDG